jgi:hypothetical protein
LVYKFEARLGRAFTYEMADHVILFPDVCDRLFCHQGSRIAVVESSVDAARDTLERIEDKVDGLRNWLLGSIFASSDSNWLRTGTAGRGDGDGGSQGVGESASLRRIAPDRAAVKRAHDHNP